ncbi:MAG: inositol monophosphatase [Candidatus Marinimicrobia bacterium]|nr:inositol monophosphatase [Candidatus Neomarinimicrobiota bacterium]
MIFEELLDVAIKAAHLSSDIILEFSDKSKVVDYKGRTDLVTIADKKSEKLIIDTILDKFQDHSILAEESGSNSKGSKYMWLIDPLDGTTNFVHGYPSYGISIACSIDNIISIAVVKDIVNNDLYTAIMNKGAFKNGKPINISKTKTLIDSLLVTGFGYNHDVNWELNMKLFKHFTDNTQGVRRLGAASIDLCHLATGIVDGFWEYDLKPWDTAAGKLIVEEAGGKITKLNGDKFNIYQNQILASNKIIHEDLVLDISSIIT